MKRLVAILLVLASLLPAIYAQGASEDGIDTSLQDVLDRGTFILGLDDSFPPMGYRDENGEIVGFDIDGTRRSRSSRPET